MNPLREFVLFLALTATLTIAPCSASRVPVRDDRFLAEICPELNPAVNITVTGSDSSGLLLDDEVVTVSVSGVPKPNKGDWVGMFSPSNQDVSACSSCASYYNETGDGDSQHPLVSHYAIKAQFLSNDPSYLKTGSASIKIHVVNLRSELEFVVFSGGFLKSCVVARSKPVNFKDPSKPNFLHLASADSSGESMKLTWISNSNVPQQVFYGKGQSATSSITKFEKDIMNGEQSAAYEFGWHNPGFIHTALLTGLKPSTNYTYSFSDGGKNYTFKTPPVSGSNHVRFIAMGDMGRGAVDNSIEHLLQPGSQSVVKAMTHEVNSGKIDAVFHLGGLSYATGFLPQWDYYLKFIEPVASHVPYMTAIGSTERDCVNSPDSVYSNPASGGECGVPYLSYFPMPSPDPQAPWYSVEHGSVHFVVMSSEDDWHVNTARQHEWLVEDLGSVNRTRTPWIILMGHRPVFTSKKGEENNVDMLYTLMMNDILTGSQVDLALFSHWHHYERLCAGPVASGSACTGNATVDEIGKVLYPSQTFHGTVHLTVGTGGAKFDDFREDPELWSLARIKEHGYLRVHVTGNDLHAKFISSTTRKVLDEFRISKTV